MGELVRQEDQQRVGDVGNCAEQPPQDRQGNDGGHYNHQAGPKVGLPARENTLLHTVSVCERGALLKAKRGRQTGMQTEECRMKNPGHLPPLRCSFRPLCILHSACGLRPEAALLATWGGLRMPIG